MILSRTKKVQVKFILDGFFNFLRSSKYVSGKLKEREASVDKIPLIGKIETIILQNFLNRFDAVQGISFNQDDKRMFFLAALNLYILKNLEYFYYPLNSENKEIDLPVNLLLDLIKWNDRTTRAFTIKKNQHYNRYWSPIKEEFNIHGLISAVNEMVDDFFIMTLENLQRAQGENKILIVENRLKKRIIDMISNREIDDVIFFNAIEEYKQPNLIIAFCAPSKEDIRELLKTKYGFFANERYTKNILYKNIKSGISYSEIKKAFLILQQDIEQDETLASIKKSIEHYMIQLFLVHSSDLHIISDYFELDKLKELKSSVKAKEKKITTTILEIMDQIRFLNVYFGNNVDEMMIQTGVESLKQLDGSQAKVQDLFDLDDGSLKRLFNIDDERFLELREELELIASMRAGNAKIIVPIPEKISIECFNKKLQEIYTDIEQAFTAEGIKIPNKFLEILQRLYDYKMNIEENGWKTTQKFTDEVKDFHPHVKNAIEKTSMEKWESENQNNGRIEHVVNKEVFLEYKLLRKNKPSKDIETLFNVHYGQVSSEMVSSLVNIGFLVVLDVHDQGHQSFSDVRNYFRPYVVKGGKGTIPDEDIAPRGVVVVLINGGKRTTHSNITNV